MTTFRFAARALLRRPSWAALTVAVLSLGFACVIATTRISRAIESPLPYQPEDRLYSVFERHANISRRETSSQIIHRLAELPSVELAAGYMTRVSDRVISVDGRSQTVRTALVTENFFRVLGLTPQSGQFFFDDRSPGLVLSSSFWSSRFGADPAVIGKHVVRDGFVSVPVPILGVAPPRVDLPRGTDCWSRINLRYEWYDKTYVGIVRLKPEHSLATFQSQLDNLARHAQAIAGRQYTDVRIEAQPLRAAIRGRVDETARLFALIAQLVFLIGCFNAFALIAFRVNERRADLRLCSMLGASRSWIATIVLVEVALILLAALLLAGALASVGSTVAFRLLPTDVVVVDWWSGFRTPSIFVVAVVFCLASAAYALVVAWRSERDRSFALALGHRIVHVRGQIALILMQTAAAVVLLAVAVAALQDYLVRKRGTEVPSEESLLVIRLRHVLASGGPNAKYPYESFARDTEAIVEKIQDVARMPAAAASLFGVADTADGLTVRIPAEHGVEEHKLTLVAVTPSFFGVTGIPIIEGRPLLSSDRLDSDALRRQASNPRQGVIVLSPAAARLLFPNRIAVGNRVSVGDDFVSTRTVVGITGNVPSGFAATSLPVAFVPFSERPSDRIVVLARPDSSLHGAILQTSQKFGTSTALVSLSTAAQERMIFLQGSSSLARLVSYISGVAMFLTFVAIVGAVRLAVASRERESALRIALGASPGSLIRLIIRPFALSVVAGATLGAGLLMMLASRSPLVKASGTGFAPLVIASAVTVLLLALACMVMVARRAGNRMGSLLRV